VKKPAISKKARPPEPAARSRAFDREQLVHELQVHQIELETQNRELRDTHRLLELSRDRYADLYDFAPAGYATFDGDGIIQEINLTAAAMLGMDRARLIGAPFSLFLAKDSAPAFREHLRKLERQEHGAVTELILAAKDSGAAQVEIRGAPARDADLHPRQFRSTLTDITERKALEKEILAISEREQRRIGQDLHDGLCQHLAGVEFRLLGLQQKLERKSAAPAAEAAEIARLVRDAIEQTRMLARGISPVLLEANGLADALQELAAISQRTFQIGCSLHCPKPVPVRNNAVAAHLYRIAQEALHNAVRHGKPKTVTIRLLRLNNRIVLGVEDDGVGLAARPRGHKGMGLRVMQYRAGMIGGSLVVQHRPSGGTSVVCSLQAESAGAKPAPRQ
jgi:PAS domain S-box-containing protein